MGVKLAQGELKMALQPLFAHIPQAHLIHDDLIVAKETDAEHHSAITAVMKAITSAGITLSPNKWTFRATEIEFWVLRSKEELISFLCMMQSNADFIPNFAQQAAKLRELTKKNSRFTWTKEHHAAYETLIKRFTSNTLLEFFDMSKQTFIFTDAHVTGLGAMLA